jgi:hypothetical protein
MGAAAAPMIIGSAIGAATNRKNPLQGALLGGALGGFGSAFTSGFSSLGNAAANTATSTAANTGLGMAGNAVQTMPGAVGAFGQNVPAMSNVVTEAAASSVDDLIGQGLSADLALNAGAPAAYTGMGMAGNTAPSFLDKLGAGAKEIGQYAQQNPVLTQMAMQSGQGLLQKHEPQMQSAGLMRGSPTQGQAPQYQLGIPKVSLI